MELTIGKLSQLTGLTTKTIRYYEEEGLIEKAKRRDNGYRQYESKTTEDLKMIKYARDLGLPIGQIRKLMTGCTKGNCRHNKEYLNKEIQEYRILLEQKMTQMKILERQLGKLAEIVNDEKKCPSNDKYCCNILHQLTELPKGGEE